MEEALQLGCQVTFNLKFFFQVYLISHSSVETRHLNTGEYLCQSTETKINRQYFCTIILIWEISKKYRSQSPGHVTGQGPSASGQINTTISMFASSTIILTSLFVEAEETSGFRAC